MYVDALTLAAVADELKATILGGRVQETLAVDDLSLGFEVYANRRRHYLIVGAHPQVGRVQFTETRLRRGVEIPSPLLLLLRKWVRRARLDRIDQPPSERILHFGFDHPEQGTSTLVVEIMGRHSNIILIDESETILECIKRVGSDGNRYSDGFTILVGRSSRQNAQLTFKTADGEDWWFHARGIAGAHVILRAAGRQPTPAAVQRAAELAAAYSAARHDTHVPVDYTRCRLVRRRPGGGPGQVLYRHEQTLTVRPAKP